MWQTFIIAIGRNILKAAYTMGGRSYIKSKIDDPNSDWDEKAMKMLDGVMNVEK